MNWLCYLLHYPFPKYAFDALNIRRYNLGDERQICRETLLTKRMHLKGLLNYDFDHIFDKLCEFEVLVANPDYVLGCARVLKECLKKVLEYCLVDVALRLLFLV